MPPTTSDKKLGLAADWTSHGLNQESVLPNFFDEHYSWF